MGLALLVEHFRLCAGDIFHGIRDGVSPDIGQQGLGLLGIGRVGGVEGGQDGTVHDAALPDDAGQVAGIDALNTDGIVFLQKAVQRFLAAPVGGGLAGLTDDIALCPDAVGLHIVAVHAVVADERVGLGDDLAIVAGVSQRLLKAHHTGGKDDLAHGDALSAHRLTGKDHAVRQKKICVHSVLLVFPMPMTFPVTLTGSAWLPASSCGCPDAPEAACPPCRGGTPRERSWAGPA